MQAVVRGPTPGERKGVCPRTASFVLTLDPCRSGPANLDPQTRTPPIVLAAVAHENVGWGRRLRVDEPATAEVPVSTGTRDS